MTRKDTSCGVGLWQPTCMQRFASSRVFIGVFGLLGTIQAMSFVYFIATLTTLEKRFQMPSQTMGILMSGNEVSQIMLVLILSHLGGKGNRPLWIAWGVAISALSCFILALPHFIYGPGPAALALTAEYLDVTVLNSTTGAGDKNPLTCDTDRKEPECSSADLQRSLVPMILVFISQFVLGIGTSLYFSLGQTYMDDNTKKSSTPMLLGVTMALRTLGPACGFVLGSLCLSLYISPSLSPLIERRDPRWLGAWWLGWVLLGSTMIFFAFLIGMFPRNLRKQRSLDMVNMQRNPIYVDTCRPVRPDERDSLFSDFQKSELLNLEEIPLREQKSLHKTLELQNTTFWASLKRILTNPLLMVNNFTAVFYILGASGYMTFFNKYTETQYNSSAALANMVAAVMTIFSLVIGFLASGYVISRFKPRTSRLLLWNVFVGVVYMTGEIIIMFLKCDDVDFQANITDSGTLDPSAECNSDCVCDSVRYSPVCDGNTNKTYFSACHAGCSSMNLNDLGKRTFSNCSCIEDLMSVLTQGPCPLNCEGSFYMFMGTVCFMQMIGCTGRITNVLINYRSVLPQDKAIAQGLALMLISLFAFIPGPILFGKIVDNACLVWDNTCGEKGNCWLYDKTNFRIYLNATAAGFSAVAVILDVILYVLGKHIPLYEEAATLHTREQHNIRDTEVKLNRKSFVDQQKVNK